jgi:hypothetical protein
LGLWVTFASSCGKYRDRDRFLHMLENKLDRLIDGIASGWLWICARG